MYGDFSCVVCLETRQSKVIMVGLVYLCVGNNRTFEMLYGKCIVCVRNLKKKLKF